VEYPFKAHFDEGCK